MFRIGMRIAIDWNSPVTQMIPSFPYRQNMLQRNMTMGPPVQCGVLGMSALYRCRLAKAGSNR